VQSLVNHGLLGFSNDDYVRSGRIMDSARAVSKAVNGSRAAAFDSGDHGATSDMLQLNAQLMMLLDQPDDALEYFEQRAKHAPDEAKGDRHARSCLVAGVQCLRRNQVRTAWNCFKRLLDIKGAPAQVQAEASAAMAALYFGLGMRRPAENALRHCNMLVAGDEPGHVTPQAVLRVLQMEFVALDLLRQHPGLEDLAFWPRHEEAARKPVDVSEVLERLAACRSSVEPYALLTARLDFLAHLLRLAYDGAAVFDKALSLLSGLDAVGWGGHGMSARHELALACIAGAQHDGLRRLMHWQAASAGPHGPRSGNFEHEYCLAKLGEQSGRQDIYIAHYRRYATQAMIQVRRACAYISVPTPFRHTTPENVRDDIGSRLPGRYRRAYQYILANLPRRELSVRHVADSIGVTERALQLAFREHLGLSPSALIRRCRMERIRSDLSEGAASHGATTLVVAQRWGVASRSALRNGYHSAFGESPRETACEPLLMT
jgi:AraC-like DNA-binding protein